MKTASWVVISKQTGRAVLETFNPKLAVTINRDRYEVLSILEYLQRINVAIQETKGN